MERKQLGIEIKEIDMTGRTIEAIVSTSDLDDGNDIILPGAFARTLREDAKRVKMLWQHQGHKPIGRPLEMRELPQGGLFVKSYVSKIQQGEDFLTLAEEKIVDEFSIGYSVNESEDDGKIRKISDLKLWEFSPVTWGMNPNTSLLSIKSIDKVCPKEIERVLRDAGLSRKEAKSLISGGFKCLRDADNSGEVNELSLALKNFNSNLKV